MTQKSCGEVKASFQSDNVSTFSQLADNIYVMSTSVLYQKEKKIRNNTIGKELEIN